MKKVVIIGGGFAGSLIAKGLQDSFLTILIDTKDYFEFTPGILRTLVEPEHSIKIQVMHKTYLKKTTFIRGEVSEVTNNSVIIWKKKILFDYLIICSGSTYNKPIKEKNLVISTRAETLK